MDDKPKIVIRFDGFDAHSKQPYYNVIFNGGTMPIDLAALPDPVYDELSERVGAVIDHFVLVQSALVEACEAWDQGFVDGEEFDADQFLAWVNRKRAAARAALTLAKGNADG